MPGVYNKDKWSALATTIYIKKNLTGVTVVIAPHPDDESLGCGGTIALLKKAGGAVKIIFVSDGSMSHPNSKKYPAPLLIQLREKEAVAAAEILGVGKEDCYFMRLQDGGVPDVKANNFSEAVAAMQKILLLLNADTILLPWKNDPHRDHKATWQIVNKAVQQIGKPINLFHYLIWFWERGSADKSLLNLVDWYKINISSVLELKKEAIAAHQSQLTHLIDDDDDGFMLSKEVLKHFNDPFELFAQLKTKTKK